MIEQNGVIDAEEIEEYIYSHLVKRGYAPASEEIEELADIFFDYLLEKGVLKEVE